MLLNRSAYFKNEDDSHRLLDSKGMVILSIEKKKTKKPFITIEVVAEIPKKVANLWKIPYDKNYKPLIRTVLTWDTTSVIKHWRKYDSLFEYRIDKYIGDPRNAEWHEFRNDESWMPLNPTETEYYITSYKKVSGNIIPMEEIHVTDEKTKQEMAIMNIGGGAVKNIKYLKNPDKYWPGLIHKPILRWDFTEECRWNWDKYLRNIEEHPYSYYGTPPETVIERFYIEFVNVVEWTEDITKQVYRRHDNESNHSFLTDDRWNAFLNYSDTERTFYYEK